MCLALMRVLGDECVHSKHSNDHSHSAREPLKNPLTKCRRLDAQVCCAVLCWGLKLGPRPAEHVSPPLSPPASTRKATT